MPYRGPERPRLRPVEIVPVGPGGSPGFVLSDPGRVAPQPMVLSPGALFVLRSADGEHTLREMQADVARATGRIVPFEQIENLLQALDEQLYLDSPRFDAAYRVMREEYLSLPRRPAVLAGVSYPSDPTELGEYLDGLFTGPDGPGRPDMRSSRDDLCAIMVPHIDLRRGGRAFAHGYKALVEGTQAEAFVVLGIDHSGSGKPYMLTDKDFDTPLGPLPTDKAMVARLRDLAPPEALGDEYVHRSEHSIEFQAVLLRYLYPGRAITVVPILCGSLQEEVPADTAPIERPEVAGFVDALAKVIGGSGKRTCIISAVDLAHVGRRFGDNVRADDGLLRWVEQEDRAMLDAVAALSADALFRSIEKDGNRRRVCGYPAIYTMLALFERDEVPSPRSGAILAYGQSPEEETDSVVTFASMAFR